MTGFAYGSIRKTSIVPESEYPFVGAQSVCRANLSKGIVNNAYMFVSESTEITLEYNIGKYLYRVGNFQKIILRYIDKSTLTNKTQ